MQFSVLQFHLGDEIYCSFVCTHLQRHLVIQQLKWRNIFLRFLFLIGVEAKNKQLTKSNRRNSYCWISALPPKPSFFFFPFLFPSRFPFIAIFCSWVIWRRDRWEGVCLYKSHHTFPSERREMPSYASSYSSLT